MIVAGSTGSVPAVAELIATVAGLPAGEVVLPGLDRTLGEVRKAAQALRRLADTLDEEPNSLLFGRSEERSE